MKSDLLAPLAFPVFMLFVQCSPVAPPKARAGAHFRTTIPPDPIPGTTCTDSYGGIGNPPPEVANTLTETDLHREGAVVDDELAVEGNVPYEITCRITGSGDLHVNGSMEGLNTSPFRRTAGSSTKLTIDGTINANGTGGGEITFFTTATLAVTPKEGTSCTFTATPAPLMGCSNLSCLNGDAPGDYGGIAITFKCPDMNMGAASIASDCEADGTIVLDRCTY